MLTKLADTKTADNKSTLLHYLVTWIEKHKAELLTFPQKLSNVEIGAQRYSAYICIYVYIYIYGRSKHFYHHIVLVTFFALALFTQVSENMVDEISKFKKEIKFIYEEMNRPYYKSNAKNDPCGAKLEQFYRECVCTCVRVFVRVQEQC